MLIQSGSYSGTSVGTVVNTGSRPDVVIVKRSNGVKEGLMYNEMCWGTKSQPFGTDASTLSERFALTNNGFLADGSPQCGENTGEYYYLSLIENNRDYFKYYTYTGTGVDGQLFDRLMTKKPVMVWVRRDSTRNPFIKLAIHPDGVSKPMEALVERDLITTLNTDGSFTTTNDSSVNEWGAGAGESTNVLAFFDGDHIEVKEYTGTGVEQTIETTIGTPELVFVVPRAATQVSYKATGMGADTCKGYGAAYVNGVTALSNGSVTIGTSTEVNNIGDSYYIVMMRSTDSKRKAQLPSNSQWSFNTPSFFNNTGDRRSPVSTADNAVGQITGALTMELDFSITGHAESDEVCGLFGRANSPSGGIATAGAWNWGIAYNEGMAGLCVCVTNYFDLYNTDGDFTKMWRTGLHLHLGRRYHLMITHDGSGYWCLYVDGALRMTRMIDMVAYNSTPNIEGAASDRVGIFCRPNSTSGVPYQADNVRGTCWGARIYDKELTEAECLMRFERQFLGKTQVADVEFLEEWAAAEGGTETVFATNSPTDNRLETIDKANWVSWLKKAFR